MPKNNDPLKPFSTDPFSFGAPGASPDSFKPRRPRAQVPEAKVLFDLQNDLVRAISHFEREDYEDVKKPLRNAYRIINRYLKTYASGIED
jgi:hypothetical protein